MAGNKHHICNNHTSKISAALFKSRVPSSCCCSRVTNFFVNKPARHMISGDTYKHWSGKVMQDVLQKTCGTHISSSLLRELS